MTTLCDKIKYFFSRFYPLSAQRTEEAFKRAYADLENLSCSIESLRKEIVMQLDDIVRQGEAAKEVLADRMQTEIDKIAGKLAKVEGRLARQITDVGDANRKAASEHLFQMEGTIIRSINDNRILYYYPQEVKSIESRGLAGMTERPEFIKEFKELVRGLPQESVSVIATIISRLQQIRGMTGRKDIYTEAEKKQLSRIAQFNNEIIYLPNGIFCWKEYFLPARHFSPNVFYYRYGMDQLCRPEVFCKKAIIDVGAYIGDSAIILSEYTSDKVYCFEASHTNYENLLKTISLNGLSRVVPENIALGSADGEIELRVCDDRSSTSMSMVPIPHCMETCRITTLDAYVRGHEIDVGLIKVDIEGAEQDFLNGALVTIRKYRPALLLSIYHNADDFLKIKPFIESLNLDYTFRVYHPAIKSIVAETLLICEPNAR